MKALTCSVLLTVLALVCGCGDAKDKAADGKAVDGGPPVVTPNAKPAVDTGESISREIMANMKVMAGIFEGITDEVSAKAAIPKIEASRAKMRDIAGRARKVKVTKAEEAQVHAAIGNEQAEVMETLFKARAKLEEKPELLEIIKPALVGMENDM